MIFNGSTASLFEKEGQESKPEGITLTATLLLEDLIIDRLKNGNTAAISTGSLQAVRLLLIAG